ncbi:MAG: glycoside hydrolase family 97 catalytic domain-containing protein [Kiritimatiellia bacterium]
MKPFPAFALLSLLCAGVHSANAAWQAGCRLDSPDGALTFVLERDETTQALAWSVTRKDRPVVTRGALGLELTGPGVVADRGPVTKAETRSADTRWKPVCGEHAGYRDHFNEATLTLAAAAAGEAVVRLQVRAYDEGVALRYLVDGTGPFTVTGENTTFPLTAQTQVWVSDRAQSKVRKAAVDQAGKDLERPLTAELAPDLFAALGEAGQRDHARMKFTAAGAATLAARLAGPSKHPAAFATPWRYVRAAASPAELAQGNGMLPNLSEPSEIADTSWIKPGKALRETTLTTTGALACVDWIAAHGLQYILFDAGWYGEENDPRSDARAVNLDPKRSKGPFDLPAVIAHAKSRGVGVILYVNHIALEKQLDDLLPLYEKWGVAGIKFGFVNVGPQQWTSWQHDAIAKCAKHRLMVDVHDEYRMTGVERTLPNFMTSEGIRGDEESAANEEVVRTIFTRGLAGPGDQTNCYFAPRVATMGSHASQLAKTVLIYSPWQVLFWYDRVAPAGANPSAPGFLQDVPEMTFFSRLPTIWDDTRWLEGHPDTHAAVARKKDGVWFIGAINGAAERELRLRLDFLDPGKNYTLQVFSDDPAVKTPTHVRIDTSTVDRSAVLTRKLAVRNGLAAILTPAP